MTNSVGGKGLRLNVCPNCGADSDIPLHCDDCEIELCEHCKKGDDPFCFCANCADNGDE